MELESYLQRIGFSVKFTKAVSASYIEDTILGAVHNIGQYLVSTKILDDLNLFLHSQYPKSAGLCDIHIGVLGCLTGELCVSLLFHVGAMLHCTPASINSVFVHGFDWHEDLIQHCSMNSFSHMSETLGCHKLFPHAFDETGSVRNWLLDRVSFTYVTDTLPDYPFWVFCPHRNVPELLLQSMAPSENPSQQLFRPTLPSCFPLSVSPLAWVNRAGLVMCWNGSFARLLSVKRHDHLPSVFSATEFIVSPDLVYYLGKISIDNHDRFVSYVTKSFRTGFLLSIVTVYEEGANSFPYDLVPSLFPSFAYFRSILNDELMPYRVPIEEFCSILQHGDILFDIPDSAILNPALEVQVNWPLMKFGEPIVSDLYCGKNRMLLIRFDNCLFFFKISGGSNHYTADIANGDTASLFHSTSLGAVVFKGSFHSESSTSLADQKIVALNRTFFIITPEPVLKGSSVNQLFPQADSIWADSYGPALRCSSSRVITMYAPESFTGFSAITNNIHDNLFGVFFLALSDPPLGIHVDTHEAFCSFRMFVRRLNHAIRNNLQLISTVLSCLQFDYPDIQSRLVSLQSSLSEIRQASEFMSRAAILTNTSDLDSEIHLVDTVLQIVRIIEGLAPKDVVIVTNLRHDPGALMLDRSVLFLLILAVLLDAVYRITSIGSIHLDIGDDRDESIVLKLRVNGADYPSPTRIFELYSADSSNILLAVAHHIMPSHGFSFTYQMLPPSSHVFSLSRVAESECFDANQAIVLIESWFNFQFLLQLVLAQLSLPIQVWSFSSSASALRWLSRLKTNPLLFVFGDVALYHSSELSDYEHIPIAVALPFDKFSSVPECVHKLIIPPLLSNISEVLSEVLT